eukprot:14728305-Ditylum_brightwellii.AAC.1
MQGSTTTIQHQVEAGVNKVDYPSKHKPPAVHQQCCSQHIVNAAVTPENKNLAQQIRNTAQCICKVIRTKIHL